MHSFVVLSESKELAILVLKRTAATTALPSPATETATKIKLHRPVSGKIKPVSVKREGNHWYACFSCEVSAQPWPENTNQISIDVGLESFAALSTGEIVDNPGHFAKAEKRLRRTQRRVSRRKKYAKRWRKAVQFVHNVHRDITNQRRDFQHKLSREIVDANQFIAVEDLNVIGLAGGMLAQSVADVGWSSFLKMLAYQAESAGRQLVRVAPVAPASVVLVVSLPRRN